LAAYSLVSWYHQRFEKLPVLGKEEIVDGKTVPHRVAEFELQNQEGLMKKSTDWNDKIMVVDFFFTHCPSICPAMTANLKKVQEAFKKNNTVQIVSFSVDPERDSSAQLKKYALKFGIDENRWQLLTGNKKNIYKLARNSFMIVATDGDGGDADFIHSQNLVLVDKQRRIRGYYDGTDEKEIKDLIHDIKKLQHED
jgi:protein SCO1/2